VEKNQTLAYKYALVSVFLWSTVATAFKIALSYLSALELLFYASLSSLLILGVIVIFQKNLTSYLTCKKTAPYHFTFRSY
jgi:drug/metabolite transporter (DMT)-like permease